MRLFNLIKRAIGKIVREIRCAYFNRLIDEGGGKIVLPNPWMPVSIRKAPGARLIVRGRLLLQPWMEGEARTVFDLAEGSSLEFAGDFEIGHGVRILVGHKATLRFGGRCKESASGITCDSTILVHRRILIGADFLCAWGVFITDSNWHNFNGKPSQADVTIGDKVWIAHHSSVLKGTVIPDGCVIAAHSLVLGGDFSGNSLIAGSPACTKRTNIFWHRDMLETE
jgi:acetyltransferase-like isoleucine patch superfamily enzyme